MPEIQQSFLLDNLNKITRNYNSKAEGNTPVLNTIFNWFDADGNGTFNDDEWTKKEKYMQDLQAKLNTNYTESFENESGVVKLYHKRINSKLREIQQINTKTHKIYEKENYFLQMFDFEKAHGIERNGYIKKSEIPDNAIAVDISMFEMGILDNNGESFTGKTYKKGYIKFPDNISDEDKRTYLELLNKAQKQSKKVQKLMHQLEQLEKEYDTAIEYYNMAKSGQIKKIGSQEYETQMYQQYQSIREASNPYYKQFKEIEQKYNTLRLKANRSSDEENQLVQYYQIMQQLKDASLAWSTSGVKNSGSELDSSNGFSVTNVDETISYTTDGNSKELNNEHSIGFRFNNENWEVTASGSETDKYKFQSGENAETEHEGCFSLDGAYKRGKFSIFSGLTFFGSKSMKNWTPNLGVSYGDFNFRASEDITIVKQEDFDENGNSKTSSETIYATNLELGWQKSFESGISSNVTSSVRLGKNEGNNYTLSAGIQAPLLPNTLSKHNLSWTVNGKLSGSYSDINHSTTVNPSISTSLIYNKNNFSTVVTLNENLISTLQRGSEPSHNQMFTASGTIGYKQFSFQAGYSDTRNAYSNMQAIDTEASWTTSKAGTFSAGYRYTNTETKSSGENNKEHFVSFKYSAPMDVINGWFKSKKRK